MPKGEEKLTAPLIEPPAIMYDIIHPVRTTIEEKIEVSAFFTYTRQHSLFFRQGGKVKGMYVEYGEEVSKGTLLAEIENDSLIRQIDRQKINVEIARLSQKRLEAMGGDIYQLKAGALKVQLAELTLEERELDLERTRIRAPFTGVIVYHAQNIEGEYVDPYESMVQMAKPTDLVISYSGVHISDFRFGMEVEIYIDEELYLGEVVLTPDNLPEDAPSSMRSKVYIKAFDLPDEITKGQHASIHVIVARSENTIVIPRHLVKTHKGIHFVYVMEEGLRRQKNIKVGVQTSTEAEILEGLSEEDELISR